MRGGDATFDIAQGIPRNAMEGMTIRSPAGRPVLAAPTGSYELDGPVDAPVRALWLRVVGKRPCSLMLQAAVCDCCTLDAFTLDEDCLGPAEVDSAGVRLLRLS